MVKATKAVASVPEPPTGPPSAKGRRTRERLIEAAKTIFGRDGFLNARITDIAIEAGVSYGAFYHYFDSKEQIFREIAEEMEVRLLAMDDLPHDASMGGHEHDPYERIRAANRSYLTAYREQARLMAVIVEVSHYDAQVRAVRDRRQEEFGARLAASIARLQKSGIADADIDGRYAGMALGGMVANFASTLFDGRGDYDFETAVTQLSILWANAIGLPRAVGKPAGKPRAAVVKKSSAAATTRPDRRTRRSGRTGDGDLVG